MKRVKEALKEGELFLERRGVCDFKQSSEELLAHVLCVSRGDLYSYLEKIVTQREWEQFSLLLQRRGEREPLAYIIGEQQFLNCSLLVTKDVLIPRQETEIFADKIIKNILSSNLCKNEKIVLWDICTGSGSLGIAIKKAIPSLEVTLSDISEKSLEVAKKNGKRNDVMLEYLIGDLLTPFAGRKAHFIVCNPPYVSEREYHLLEKEVAQFEPKQALIGGVSGLEFYKRLAEQLPHYLHAKGKGFFEIGSGQGDSIKNFFDSSIWKVKRVELDWAGHERFFFLEIE